ncbi:hypothetical protein CsSME_00028180 [Camellia sinensis var. sinensis]
MINDALEGEEHIHQQGLERLQTENNNLQLDNTVKTVYINKLEEDNKLLTAQIQQLKDENSRLHNQLVEKEVHKITQEVCGGKNSGTDAKNVGHTIKDENSQVVQKKTIDSYAEILERDPQAQNSGDGAEHNGKSFVLPSLHWIRNKCACVNSILYLPFDFGFKVHFFLFVIIPVNVPKI